MRASAKFDQISCFWSGSSRQWAHPVTTEPTEQCQLHKSPQKKRVSKNWGIIYHHIFDLKARKNIHPPSTGATSQFTLRSQVQLPPMSKYMLHISLVGFSAVTFRLGPWQPASSSAHLPKRETLGALDFLGHQDYRRWIGSDSKVPGRFQGFGAAGVVWEVLLFFAVVFFDLGNHLNKNAGGKLYGLSVDSTSFYLCRYVIRFVFIYLISNMYILRVDTLVDAWNGGHIFRTSSFTSQQFITWLKIPDRLELKDFPWISSFGSSNCETHTNIIILVYISQKITHTYMFIYD